MQYIFFIKDSYGYLFKDVNIPTKEDFVHFDANGDGVLFYEEWLKTLYKK